MVIEARICPCTLGCLWTIPNGRSSSPELPVYMQLLRKKELCTNIKSLTCQPSCNTIQLGDGARAGAQQTDGLLASAAVFLFSWVNTGRE